MVHSSKWKSKVTGQEVQVTDGWDSKGNYYVTLTFKKSFDEDIHSWIKLDYRQFTEAFEKVEE